MTSQEIEERVASFPRWHYEFDFDGVKTSLRPALANRHRERKRYFFDPLVELCGGSLAGKRVLDLACNAGFWSLCAIEAGCDYVVGVDAREMHVEQSNFVFEAKGVETSRYRFIQANVFDVDLSDEDPFDIVLCLGLIYHVSKPFTLIEKIAAWNTDVLVIESSLSRAPGSYFQIFHERIGRLMAADYELVTYPTKNAIVDITGQFSYSTVVLKPAFKSYTGAENYKTGFRRAFFCAKRTEIGSAGLPVETLGIRTRAKDAAVWAYSELKRPVKNRLRRREGLGPVPPGRYPLLPSPRVKSAMELAKHVWRTRIAPGGRRRRGAGPPG